MPIEWLYTCVADWGEVNYPGLLRWVLAISVTIQYETGGQIARSVAYNHVRHSTCRQLQFWGCRVRNDYLERRQRILA